MKQRLVLVVLVFLGCILFLSISSRAADDIVTSPEKCLLLGMPFNMQYVSEANLFLMVNGAGVRAYDVETGTQRWHFMGRCSTGTKYVLTWSAHGLFLLDRTTGKEVWTRRDIQHMQPLWAALTPDEAQVVARYDRETVIYDVDGKGRRSAEVVNGASLLGNLSGGKVLLFHQYQPAYSGQATINRVYLVDRESGRLLRSFDLKGGKTWRYKVICSPSGQLATFDSSERDKTKVEIWDVTKEAVVRDLGMIPEALFSGNGKWTDDEKHLIVLADKGAKVCLLDTATGEIQTALTREGHVFQIMYWLSATANDMQLFSRDRDGAYWLWTLTPGMEPKKMFDGHGVASGYLRLMTMNDVCVMSEDYGMSSTPQTISLLMPEDLKRIGEWRISNDFAKANKDSWSNGGFFNQQMTHYVDIAMLRQEDNNSEYGFGVFAKDADKSVLQGHGRPLCLSPDGRYMVLQQEKNSAMLFDLTGQSTPCEFTAAENKYYQYMQAAFSDDGKWLAVNVSPEMELVSMTEGFPRKKLPKSGSWIGFPVHFSPDGTRILCRGGDRAFLYDTEKGTLLQTFVEPERFLPMYEYSGSVWNNILTSAKEWAGLVTDTFKSVNGLECTFTGNGTRVITYASGQVIRVWDSNTGQRLQTIYTKLPEKRDERGQIRNEITFSKNGDYAFAFNQDGFSTASLWSVSDGILLRRYQLPGGINTWTQVVVSDDGAVYIISDGDLNRWPGRKTDGL